MGRRRRSLCFRRADSDRTQCWMHKEAKGAHLVHPGEARPGVSGYRGFPRSRRLIECSNLSSFLQRLKSSTEKRPSVSLTYGHVLVVSTVSNRFDFVQRDPYSCDNIKSQYAERPTRQYCDLFSGDIPPPEESLSASVRLLIASRASICDFSTTLKHS